MIYWQFIRVEIIVVKIVSSFRYVDNVFCVHVHDHVLPDLMTFEGNFETVLKCIHMDCTAAV